MSAPTYATSTAPVIDLTPVKSAELVLVPRVTPEPTQTNVDANPNRRRNRRRVVAAATGITTFAGLGTAGYLFGQSALGAEIATAAVVIAVAVPVVGYLATATHGLHCPGCKDC